MKEWTTNETDRLPWEPTTSTNWDDEVLKEICSYCGSMSIVQHSEVLCPTCKKILANGD